LAYSPQEFNNKRIWSIKMYSKNAPYNLGYYQIGIHEDDLVKLIGTSYKNHPILDQETYLLQGYDTGGYTGTWGPEGRLALLHQKEIVLNAHDTENILQVVDIVRTLADKLDFNASTMASSLLGSLSSSITNIMPAAALDQNVTIHAEFPNATDRNEIQAAFGDLVNLAAQYANRK
jgi:hypothetical protein